MTADKPTEEPTPEGEEQAKAKPAAKKPAAKAADKPAAKEAAAEKTVDAAKSVAEKPAAQKAAGSDAGEVETVAEGGPARARKTPEAKDSTPPKKPAAKKPAAKKPAAGKKPAAEKKSAAEKAEAQAEEPTPAKPRSLPRSRLRRPPSLRLAEPNPPHLPARDARSCAHKLATCAPRRARLAWCAGICEASQYRRHALSSPSRLVRWPATGASCWSRLWPTPRTTTS